MAIEAKRPPFFWLHIKKAGGQSIRKALSPFYIETNRKDPAQFISIPYELWNDNLNNYRVPLGAYDYKRALFAKKFLWPEDYDSIFKFCIVRNPYDRIASAFNYLKPENRRALLPWARSRLSLVSFLDFLPELWEAKLDRHLATHTAPIWQDITDSNGNLLMDYIGKMEHLQSALDEISAPLGIERVCVPHLNKSRSGSVIDYITYRGFSKEARMKTEVLFADDFEYLGYG